MQQTQVREMIPTTIYISFYQSAQRTKRSKKHRADRQREARHKAERLYARANREYDWEYAESEIDSLLEIDAQNRSIVVDAEEDNGGVDYTDPVWVREIQWMMDEQLDKYEDIVRVR